jgi:hypothetical protein
MGLFSTRTDTTELRMDDYLTRVAGMPDVGQGRGWTMWTWTCSPVERVLVSQLYATQPYLDPARVQRYRHNGKVRSDGALPCVVHHDGRYYFADGHHRAVAAILRGDRHIRAHVKHVDGGGPR